MSALDRMYEAEMEADDDFTQWCEDEGIDPEQHDARRRYEHARELDAMDAAADAYLERQAWGD